MNTQDAQEAVGRFNAIAGQPLMDAGFIRVRELLESYSAHTDGAMGMKLEAACIRPNSFQRTERIAIMLECAHRLGTQTHRERITAALMEPKEQAHG